MTLPEQAADPDRGWFEVGEFEVSLTDATGRSIALKSTSQPLLGAPFSTGSFLEIAPGQWVTLTIKFKLEDEYRIVSDLKQGAARLEVEWRQWVRTWNLNREKCQAVRGSLYYQHLYKEQSKPLTIELTKDPILNSRTDNTDSIRTNDQE